MELACAVLAVLAVTRAGRFVAFFFQSAPMGLASVLSFCSGTLYAGVCVCVCGFGNS